MKKKRAPSGDSKNALLGDLESIRTLLDEEARAEQDAADVPLLDDVVEGALRLTEPPLEAGMIFDPDAPGGLDDELFEALLGEGWKQSAERILDQTRATIEEHRTDWAPEDTDELNEALKVRIDAALRKWLRRLVLAHIDELRAELLAAAGAALEKEVTRRLQTRRQSETKDARKAPD